MKPITILLLLLITISIKAKPNVINFFKKPIFKDFYGIIDADIKFGDAGDPLILTDLIQQNRIQEAQTASEVNVDEFLGVKSYAGYFRVDEIYNSNIFFWFFPSQSDVNTDPVILWLQGGPGSPSEFGLFEENGPLQFVDGKLTLRNTSWTISNSVIYIDQPAGTGFSFTNGGYAQNQTKVGDDLYKAIYQFFQLFPNLQTNDFFIAGESYAGKYIPAAGYAILKNNPFGDIKINLKGLAIGNGLSDPKHQLKYAEYLYQHGFIDIKVKQVMIERENKAIDSINNEDWKQAISLMDDDLTHISTASGISNIYNYIKDDGTSEDIGGFLKREDIRKALHVGNTPYNDGQVYTNLELDIPKSVAPLVSELLDHYRVLIFNGQLDIIVAYPMTVDYLQNLKFSASDEYKTADRSIWYYQERKNVVAGYIKRAGNLTEVMVRNAGHMVPNDQPEWALELINRFVKNDL